jgi:multidrug efflux pump subunit AcrA (membrane-fusion protein)
VRCAAARVLGPGQRRTKLAAAAAITITAWCAFGTIHYELNVPCRVAPARIRHVAVPFDGILVSADAVDGDRVQRGEVLCRLDQRELSQKRVETLARIAVLEREKDRAMAAGEPVNVQLSLANQELARAELEVLDTRIEQAAIRSPLDGVVVAGDLRKRIGSVVARGDPLFEVAPLDSWVLELDVPDRDVDELTGDLAGYFAPDAQPEQAQAFRVSRCRLRAETRNQKNVFVAEAKADLPFSWMRPGMEGSARIAVGRRPVWWVLSHRVFDYLRLHWWL